MGRRKPFIDKKRSTTYNLLYRAKEVDVEGEDVGPERELVDVTHSSTQARNTSSAAVTRAAGGFSSSHPLAWLQELQPDAMSAERRAELMSMGFPDDGYDYLKHMRAAGRGGKAMLPGAEHIDAPSGPSTFIPAEIDAAARLQDDIKVFDASQLTLHQAADDEVSASHASGGVTAFSHLRDKARGMDASEIAAMEAVLEELDEEFDGDLEDDFIVSATKGLGQTGEVLMQEEVGKDLHQPTGQLQWPEDDSDDTTGSQHSSQSDWGESQDSPQQHGATASQSGAPPGSIASTYWRPERSDRKNLLATVDEQFEHLALDYDEDDIGDLTDEDDVDRRGDREIDSYNTVLDSFLTSSGCPVDPSEARLRGVAYRNATDLASGGHGRVETETAQLATSQAKSIMRGYDEGPDGPTAVETCERHRVVRDRWDCESILSLRSNLDNHPASIMEPESSCRPRRQVLDARAGSSDGFIQLSRHSGIPRGVMGSRRRDDRSSAAQPEGTQIAVERSTRREDDTGSGFVAAARVKGESADERRSRKAEVKEAKRAARVAKKELKGMYKKEFARQSRAMATPAPTVIPMFD